MLGPAGVSLELASLRQSRALIHLALRSSAQTEGGGKNKYQQPNSVERALRVLLPDPDFFSPNPSWLGRAAQMEAGSGPQLFERSEFCGPPPESSSAGCPQRSVGTQTAGRLFFGYFLLAKQKKVTSRRATPGQQSSIEPNATNSIAACARTT